MDKNPSGPQTSWLAVWTKPRSEKHVARMLGPIDVPFFLPTFTTRRRWSDRWKEVELPLFPSYLFAEVALDDWSRVLRVPGVLTVVKQGRKPAWISEPQMQTLRLALERLRTNEVEPTVVMEFYPGERVRVIDGPMAGLVGIVREVRGSRRILVGFEQIGRALSVSIGAANVEHCSPAAGS